MSLDCPEFPPDCDPPIKKPPIGYTANATYTAKCPDGSYGQSVTVKATGTSVLSKEDAYNKALEAARARAEAMLDCGTKPIGAKYYP